MHQLISTSRISAQHTRSMHTVRGWLGAAALGPASLTAQPGIAGPWVQDNRRGKAGVCPVGDREQACKTGQRRSPGGESCIRAPLSSQRGGALHCRAQLGFAAHLSPRPQVKAHLAGHYSPRQPPLQRAAEAHLVPGATAAEARHPCPPHLPASCPRAAGQPARAARHPRPAAACPSGCCSPCPAPAAWGCSSWRAAAR